MDVSAIVITDADLAAVEVLRFRSAKVHGRTFRGDGQPWGSEARAMARRIRSPETLVRRAKAVVRMYGAIVDDPYGGMCGHYTPGVDGRGGKYTEAYAPFDAALRAKGFTLEQRRMIERGL